MDKKIKNAICEPIRWPSDLLMQPIETIWTILEGGHPGIILFVFNQIPIGSLGEEVVQKFLYIIQCKIVTTGWGQFEP